MTTARRKTDLSTLEAIVVEHTLGSATQSNGQSSALARIQLLTRERAQLYAHSAAHPFFAPRNAQRIRAINVEIEVLWEELRRERAQRRAQIERALNVTAEEEEKASLDAIFEDEEEPTPRARRAPTARRTLRSTATVAGAEDIIIATGTRGQAQPTRAQKAPRKASSARRSALPATIATTGSRAEVAGVA